MPDDLVSRVDRLEEDMREMRAVLGRLEPLIIRMEAQLTATLPHLATRAEVATLGGDLRAELGTQGGGLRAEIGGIRAEMGDIKAALAEKPGKTYLWSVLAALLAAYACGLAALAILK